MFMHQCQTTTRPPPYNSGRDQRIHAGPAPLVARVCFEIVAAFARATCQVQGALDLTVQTLRNTVVQNRCQRKQLVSIVAQKDPAAVLQMLKLLKAVAVDLQQKQYRHACHVQPEKKTACNLLTPLQDNQTEL